MTRLLRTLPVAAAIASWTTLAQDPPPRVEPSSSAPLGKVLEWTSAEGKPYWYRLPRKLEATRPPNLLLMLHGTGLAWGWAFWNYPISDGTFRGDDVVVAPEGMADGGGGTFNFVQGKPDREHVAGLIRDFKKRLPIGRVYLYGHSQGAFFAYWFAGEHPELVDGIVGHAGNVLGNVRHPRAAKEKVAVGILHGRADAVVPVDCAYATEKVYKDQGYRKLKLVVVEGLTAETGHWPLPKQVAEMLDWLDQVSIASARSAIEVALGELKKEHPDVGVVADAVAAASKMMGSAPAAEKAAVAERNAALTALLAELVERHAAAVTARPESRRDVAAFGPWASHFRSADRQLGALSGWQAAAKDLRLRAASQEKAVAAAAKKLEKAAAAAFQAGVKAAESAFLAPGYDDLVAALSRIADAPPRGLSANEVAAFRTMVEARAADAAAGAEAAAAVTRDVVGRFRETRASWFE
jgi:predicted esterase